MYSHAEQVILHIRAIHLSQEVHSVLSCRFYFCCVFIDLWNGFLQDAIVTDKVAAMEVLRHFVTIIYYSWNWERLVTIIHLISIINLRPRQNGRHFADKTVSFFFLYEISWICSKFHGCCLSTGPINNKPALVQIMVWRHTGDSRYLMGIS